MESDIAFGILCNGQLKSVNKWRFILIGQTYIRQVKIVGR